jgi:hypothetical protein
MTVRFHRSFIFLVAIYAAIQTANAEQTTMTAQANAGGGKLSSIQSLTARAQNLSRSGDWWNDVYKWCIAAAFVAGAAVFISNWVALGRSRQLAIAQEELITEKERQAATDSKAKDLEIAAAQEGAAEANKLAKQATARAEEANLLAKGLERESLSLRSEIAGLTLAAETAKKEAAVATLKFEELRRQVAPRNINRDPFLKALAGQPKNPVEIMYLRDDPECFDVAQQFWRALQDAGWEVSAPVPIPVTWESLGAQSPLAMSVNGQPRGVTLATRSVSEKEIEDSHNMTIPGATWGKTPWTVLLDAIGQSLGTYSSHIGGVNAPPAGIFRIVVAPRT